MLTTAPTVHLRIIFQDRNGNEGRVRAYLPFATSDAQVRSFTAFYIPYLQSLSNATVVGWTATWGAKDPTPELALLTADVSEKLVLVYRLEDIFDWIWVPAPRLDLLEVYGDYAGIRLDTMNPEVVPILASWQAVVTAITNSRGDPFPIEFVAAGLSL